MDLGDLDLLVIGSGPSGQRAAVQAAKLGKRVAVVDRRKWLGGGSIHTGTIPSKTLRQAVLEELAHRELDLEPEDREARERAQLDFLMARTRRVVDTEVAVVRDQLRRNGIGILFGDARFVDPHTVAVQDVDHTTEVTAAHVVIAVGTRPARPAGVQFDDRRVIDSDGVLELETRVPRTMCVVGAGVIGVEYASMFGRLGTRVTLVDQRRDLLPFLDAEIREALSVLLRRHGVTLRLGEEVASVELRDEGALTRLASGKVIASDTVLYTTGRQGATDGLDLEKAGLEADPRGRIKVDDDHRTAVPHIYAVGDVAGPPGLAAVSFEQGRRATLHAFDQEEVEHEEPVRTSLLPTGVYAIPEVAMVGRTEQELTDEGVPYEVGVARFAELARGVMSGDEDGILKLLVSPDDRSILGVHILGTSAADLIHIGHAVMGSGGNLDFLVSAVFNYPTFAEAYKVAALDARNRLEAWAP